LNEDQQRRKFAAVVLPHLADALSLARWLTGNAADAEDVVQEASIRAFRAVDSLRDGQPKAWLFSIVRNTAFTWLAKNRPKTLLVTDDEKIFERAEEHVFAPASDSSAETELIAKADAEMLQREIAALPLSYREVLVLREIEGMNYREISTLMSIPVGTVMSRLSRARALLIERIGKENAKEKKSA
jgi:RNA polymerase sigma factor (sigma-70 family)